MSFEQQRLFTPFQWLIVLMCVGFWLAYASSGVGYAEWRGMNPLGRDFYNFFNGGRAAWTGDVAWLYDREAYGVHNMANGVWSTYNFSYPPHSLPLLAPFGAFPYRLGFAMWAFGSAIAYFSVFRRVSFSGDSSIKLLVLMSPAVLISFFWGQTGMWVAALLGGGLILMPRKPLVAGVFFGILTVKPQIGLLLAPVLLFGGHYKVIIAATATTMLMVAVSVALYGLEPWTIYLTDTLRYQSELLERSVGVFDYMVLTPYRSLILLGISKSAAMAVHILVMATIVAVVAHMSIRKDEWTRIASALLIGTAFMSPYFVVYDLVILGLGMMFGWAYFSASTKNLLVASIFLALSPTLFVTGLPPTITALPTAIILLAGGLALKSLYDGRIFTLSENESKPTSLGNDMVLKET